MRTGAGAITESYGYDDTGRRIRKVSGAVTTYSVYQGSDANAEYATWANPAAVYTYGPGTDMPVIRAAVTGTATYGQALYYHADGLGSIVGISNNTNTTTNTTTNTQRFDAWGAVLSGTLPGSARFGYTGREPDASGLTYYRARYYDPAVGRFTQRDPIGLQGGLNQYGYVGNSPINFTDPLGLHPQSPSWNMVADAGKTYVNGIVCDACHEGFISGTQSLTQASNKIRTAVGQALDACGNFCDAGFQMSIANSLPPGPQQIEKLIGVAFGGLRAVANLGKVIGASEAVTSDMVRVGRWMSETEMTTMQNTGRVVESKLESVTSVTSPPNAMQWLKQTDGSHFVEFSIPKNTLRASDGMSGKIYGPNSIFGPKLGIDEMPLAIDIIHTATKIP